ncbi:MAG: hypothetical protein AAGJ08_23505 [Cyanobacteria bacterium P01_H01_bin.35]
MIFLNKNIIAISWNIATVALFLGVRSLLMDNIMSAGIVCIKVGEIFTLFQQLTTPN